MAKKYFKFNAIYKQLFNGQDRLNPHRGGSGGYSSFRRHYHVHMLVLGHPGPLSNLASRLLLLNRKSLFGIIYEQASCPIVNGHSDFC